MVIVGLTACIVFESKDTTIDQSSGEIVSRKTGNPVGMAAQMDSGVINSDMDMEELSAVSHLFFELGDGVNKTTFAFNTNGFSRTLCADQSVCTSKYLVTFYTTDVKIMYHGTDAFLADPSDHIKDALKLQGIPQSFHRALWYFFY